MWDRGLEPKDAWPRIEPEGWQIPVWGSLNGAMNNPSAFTANPYSLPLPADARLAIGEGDLQLIRMVDLAPLRWHHRSDGQAMPVSHMCPWGRRAGREMSGPVRLGEWLGPGRPVVS
jgi:hypothetical protein